MKLAWGKKVSREFARKAIRIANELGRDPSELMSCMAFESMETFSPSVVNKVSGATGLIQFMRPTARSLGTTTAQLANMSAVEQLDYVRAYFRPYRGKIKSIDDFYMVILWPAAVGKPSDYVLFDENVDKTHRAYLQNKGLDVNKNGQVTKAEAAAQVRAKLRKGLGANFALNIDIEGEPPVIEPEEVDDNILIPRERPKGDRYRQIKVIQTALRDLTYYRGMIDGGFGGKMAAAIAGFLTDWNERDGDITPPKTNEEFDEIADSLQREIEYAIAEGFKRPVTKDRAEAKPEIVEEVAPSTVPQKRGIIATAWASFVAFLAGILNTFGGYVTRAWDWVTGNKDQLPDAVTDPGWLSWAFGKVSNMPPAVWLFGGALILGFVALGLIKAVKMQVDDVRTGKL